MASAKRLQESTTAIGKLGAYLKAPNKKLKLFGGTMVSSIGEARCKLITSSVKILVLIAAMLLAAPPLQAQEVTLNCGPGGKLLSVVANGNRTVMPAESNLADRLAFLRREIEQKRKKYLSEICAEAETCLGQLGSGDRKKWGFRDSIVDIGLILAQAVAADVAADVDSKDGQNDNRLWDEQTRLERLADTDPDAYRIAARESLEKLKISARNSNPAAASAAFEAIEKMLSICRNNGVAGDYDSNKKATAPSVVKLEYPNRGINRNKIGQYDKHALEKVVEHALLADIDPYAALAIVMLEDAPIANGGSGYRERYGRIPVDAIGAFDTLGCFSSATKRQAIRIQPEERSTYKKLKASSDRADGLFSAVDKAIRKKREAIAGKDARYEDIYYEAQAAISNEFGRDEEKESRAWIGEYQTTLRDLERELATVTRQLDEAKTASQSTEPTPTSTPTSLSTPSTPVPESVTIDEVEPSSNVAGPDGKETQPATNQVKHPIYLIYRITELRDQIERTTRQIRFAEEDLIRDRARRDAQREAFQTAMKDPEMARALELYRATELARREYYKFRQTLDYEKLAELDCLEDQKRCQGRLQAQSAVPTFDLRSVASESLAPETTRKFCSTATFVMTGSNPALYEIPANETDSSKNCCAEVKSNLPRDEARVALLSHLGAEFFRKNIQSCFGTQPVEKCLQKFNGMGCFGCTEKMPNNCYDGIVGSDRPIYGARAADLMLNTLMPNPEISGMIGAVAKKIGRTGFSSFCRGKPEGKVTVATNSFFEMQKRFLLEGEKTPHLARFGNGLRKPATAAELDLYKKREAERAKQCSVHFR